MDGQGRATVNPIISFIGCWLVTGTLASCSLKYSDYGLQGLWGSQTIGESVAAVVTAIFVLCSNWQKLSQQAIERSKADEDEAKSLADEEECTRLVDAVADKFGKPHNRSRSGSTRAPSSASGSGGPYISAGQAGSLNAPSPTAFYAATRPSVWSWTFAGAGAASKGEGDSHSVGSGGSGGRRGGIDRTPLVSRSKPQYGSSGVASPDDGGSISSGSKGTPTRAVRAAVSH